MNTELRRTVIAGNWKMNKTPSETTAFIKDLAPCVADATCDVVCCVPYVCLQNAVEAAKGTNIKIGAQNMHFEAKGAFTGEIAADMLKDLGVEYVIIGHSERRQYYAETDESCNKKVLAALAAGLKVILCVGELKDQRVNGVTNEVVGMQTKLALLNVKAEDLKNVIIAYEPVWAIGTGLTATADQADETNGAVRAAVADVYGKDVAETVTVQYGGSMNAGNADELLAKYNVDGGLIGGASLKVPDFTAIVKSASK